jgi:hypothetical protein
VRVGRVRRWLAGLFEEARQLHPRSEGTGAERGRGRRPEIASFSSRTRKRVKGSEPCAPPRRPRRLRSRGRRAEGLLYSRQAFARTALSTVIAVIIRLGKRVVRGSGAHDGPGSRQAPAAFGCLGAGSASPVGARARCAHRDRRARRGVRGFLTCGGTKRTTRRRPVLTLRRYFARSISRRASRSCWRRQTPCQRWNSSGVNFANQTSSTSPGAVVAPGPASECVVKSIGSSFESTCVKRERWLSANTPGRRRVLPRCQGRPSRQADRSSPYESSWQYGRVRRAECRTW